MNGRGFDCLLIPIWLFVWFMIAVKYQFVKPFESSYDSNGKAIVITYQEAINNAKGEAARTAQLAKEAAEIKASYAQAYKDCNDKSYNKIGTTSAIDVKYFFNSYSKTCTKYTTTADMRKNQDGTYENYNVQVFDEIAFTRNELKDYMLIYRN